MTLAVLTPWARSQAIELGGNAWLKQVLPVGEINYKGRVLRFTRDYLARLKDAFDARAYDQVPLQLADAHNTHTNDPERTRGEITGMEVRDDGLYVRVQTTPEGSKVIEGNPRLGVSARIVEGYDRSDGRYFPAAIQHVLGTLDPRIPGLGPWQAIEASNDDVQVIDLSGELFTEEGGGAMPDLTPDQQARLAKLLDVPEDQFNAMLSGMTLTPGDLDALGADEEDIVNEIEAMSDAEFQQLLAEYGEDVAEPAGAAALSNEAAFAIDLANAQAAEAQREVQVISARLAEQDYMVERRRLADLGIPPFITDLARPLLEGAGRTVELSNGNRVDAGQVMRRVLTEVAKQAQMLDLGVELGTQMDEPPGYAAEQRESARGDVVSRARAQMFGL